jgi:hypothetical protein
MIIRPLGNTEGKYKWEIGYLLKDNTFDQCFKFTTARAAIQMLNYLNGGTGKCDLFLLEDNIT